MSLTHIVGSFAFNPLEIGVSQLLQLQIFGTAFILLLSLIEALVLQARKPGSMDWAEAWLSIGDMLGRRLLALLPLNIATPVFAWAWEHRVFTVGLGTAASFFLLFLGLEFCYYWYHRSAHRVRFFWASHSVHHSPNQLTLSTSFRLGWTGKLTGSGLFFTPLVWLGFDPKAVAIALSLNLLYQFWLHTTWIPRLGWLEYVFNTPSSHRVHHASNLNYLDANYGGVLIIFDRLFGTYVPERAQEPCVYGLVKPMVTRNLFTMEFDQWLALWKDMRASRSPVDAVAQVFMPPGWTATGGGQTTKELRRLNAVPATVAPPMQ